MAGEMMDAEGVQEEAAASKATIGNPDSPNTANIIEIESSSTSASHSTSESTSLDIDNIPLNRVYANLVKSLSPSPSTKHQKKRDDDDTFVPMYPSVLERIGEMSQMRINVCASLPADHPFQPPVIESLQFIPADAEVVSEPAEPESTNHEKSSSSHANTTTQTSESSVLVNYQVLSPI